VRLTVSKISKSFGQVNALKDISFQLAENEILGIIGPSGGGKTTLLRCIDILENVDSGIISYEFGRDIYEISSNKFDETSACLIRKNIGVVTQGLNLWEERTVFENLVLAPKVVLGQSFSESKALAERLCNRFGLADKLYARTWQLSGGQKQRIAIIRAVMMHPKLLLLDEVTSALDPVLTVEVMEFISDLKTNNVSMVIVTHHIEFACSICDRIVFLAEGRIVQIDKPEVIVREPATKDVMKFLTILSKAR